MNRKRFVLVVPLGIALSAGLAVAQDSTYNHPLYRGNRLDWCLTWGAGCGRPAADAFCNRRRFTRAVVFRAELVGSSTATRTIGGNQVCSGQDFCTAFAYLTCETPISRSRIFGNPVWMDRRLDVCREWGANCGQPAADAFCRDKGFSSALAAEPDEHPGYTPTRIIGTNQPCDGSFCTGFQQIICQ